jgi:hypothetical protein
MFDLIPFPYRVLIAVLLGLTLAGSGFMAGHTVATNAAEAQRAKEANAALVKLNEQIALGNTLSNRLAQAQGAAIVKTVEVIKHVPQVTTGRLCLDTGALGLLQPGGAPGTHEASSTSAAENTSALAASDRDVAYWVAEANQQYDTCSLRLNALVDYLAP